MVTTTSQLCPQNECQQLLAVHLGTSEGNAATLTHNIIIGRLSKQKCFRRHCQYALKMSVNIASTERPPLLAMHLGKLECSAATSTDNRTIGRLSRQKCFRRHRHYALKMRVKGASMTFGHPSSKIRGQCCDIYT